MKVELNKTDLKPPVLPKLRWALALVLVLFFSAVVVQLWRGKLPVVGGAGVAVLGALALLLAVARYLVEQPQRLAKSLEWAQSRVTPYALGLALLSGLGLALRFYGLNNGLPYVIPADESLIVDAGTHILKTGDFDPYQYFYPGLYIYLETLVYALHFIWGVFTGLYHSLQEWPDKTYDVTSAPQVYLWGRAFTVLVGTSGIGLVYYIVKTIWQDCRAALIAAGLLAFSALAIEHSQYISVDVLLSTLALLALWPAWVIAEYGQRRGYVFFGIATGLAISTKWNAGLVLVTALLAHFFYLYREKRLREWLNANLLILFGTTALATLASTPFAIADMRGYTNSFVTNLEKYQLSTGTTASDTPLLSNLQVLWNDSALAALLMAGGLLLAILRHSRRDLLLIIYPLVYLVSLNGLRLIYPRNVLPITYYGVILAALFIVWLIDIPILKDKPLLLLASFKRKPNPTTKGLNPTQSPSPLSSFLFPLSSFLLIGLIMFAPIRNALYGGWYNSQPFSYTRVGDWLEQKVGPGPLKLAELRPQQWPKGYPNLFAVRDDPKKIGNQADAQPLAYYRERGIVYLAINDDRAGPFLDSGKGNYPDLFSNGQIVEHIETRTVEKPGPAFTIISTGVTPETLRLQHPLPTRFGPALNLLGFNLGKVKTENEIFLPAPGPIKSDWPVFKPGEIIGLSVYWQPQARPERDYVVFIHLRPAGQPDTNVAARDTAPLLGGYPTSQWKPGEILTDTPNLPLPANLAPGDYTLVMGLYSINPDKSLTPLLVANGAKEVALGTVKLQK